MIKLFYKTFSTIHVFLYRLTGGRLGSRVQGLDILVLTTTGRKTGKMRATPLGYFDFDGSYVITGSNSGRKSHPAWFYNLKSNPQAMTQIKDKQFEVQAEITGQGKRDQLWERLIQLSPGYSKYSKRTRREIPMVILCPV